jgi:transposase
MRYELTDHEWTAIRPMLPNKPRRATGERPSRPQRQRCEISPISLSSAQPKSAGFFRTAPTAIFLSPGV